MSALGDDELINLARGVIEADGRAVHAALGALDEEFVRVARLLSGGTAKVLVTGSGTSGAIANGARSPDRRRPTRALYQF